MSERNRHAVADLFFQARWHSPGVRHTEAHNAEAVNLWRDILPGPILTDITRCRSGDLVSMKFAPGKLVPAFDRRRQHHLRKHQFDTGFFPHRRVTPRSGRFFPKGMLSGVAGIFKANMTPFRLFGRTDNGGIQADLNHPLSQYEVELGVTISHTRRHGEERGGTSHHGIDRKSDLPLEAATGFMG